MPHLWRFPVLYLVLCVLSHGKTVVPRVKWGQNKDQLFISVIVRDLQTETVSVQLDSESDLCFSAKSKEGQDHVLQLPLRDDVKQDSLKWEITARPDKWGTATLITLDKVHGHRWDLVTGEKQKFKGLIDKDWTREDQTLEPVDETSFFDDADTVLRLTQKNFNKTLAAHSCLVLAARYPWCSDCKHNDQVFLKASAVAKAHSKKHPVWKKVAFAYLDARENKPLGRRLDVTCSFTCEYLVFQGSPEEDPARIRVQYDEWQLLRSIEPFLVPSVMEVTSAEAERLKVNTTALGYFKSKDQKEFRSFRAVAHQMRGQLEFAAVLGKESRDHIELWNRGEGPSTLPFADFSANKSVLQLWLRQRSLPLFQEYDFTKRDEYDRSQLPIAKLFYDELVTSGELLRKVNFTMMAVAKQLLGRLAFVKLKKSMHIYEMRDFGLANLEPDLQDFPSFGIADNLTWTSRKFGFDLRDRVPSTSPEAFWSDPVLSRTTLLKFCEDVLAGNVPESHESGEIHSNWTKGEVKRLVWRRFQELKSPQKNLLLEVYGRDREDHVKKSKEVENLARVLTPYSDHLMVAGYDTSENYLPPEEFPREKYSLHSEWFWIPVGGPPTRLNKPKKDASIKKVLQFLSSHTPDLKLSVSDLFAEWEVEMKENPPPETEETGAGGPDTLDPESIQEPMVENQDAKEDL